MASGKQQLIDAKTLANLVEKPVVKVLAREERLEGCGKACYNMCQYQLNKRRCIDPLWSHLISPRIYSEQSRKVPNLRGVTHRVTRGVTRGITRGVRRVALESQCHKVMQYSSRTSLLPPKSVLLFVVPSAFLVQETTNDTGQTNTEETRSL